MISPSDEQRRRALNVTIITDEPDSGTPSGPLGDLITRNKKSPGNVDSDQCRYCWEPTVINYSCCHCSNALCRECLLGELRLTEARNQHVMHCTVCLHPYPLTLLPADGECRSTAGFLFSETFCCGSRFSPGPAGERVGLSALFMFLTIWLCCTTYSVLNPTAQTFYNLASAEFFIYCFLIAMEFLVANCVIFFVHQVKFADLGLAAYVMLLYFFRLLFVVSFGYLRPGVSLLGDGYNHPVWAAWILVGLSGCVVLCCVVIYRVKAKGAVRRFLLRQSHFKVGGNGPFSVRDLLADMSPGIQNV